MITIVHIRLIGDWQAGGNFSDMTVNTDGNAYERRCECMFVHSSNQLLESIRKSERRRYAMNVDGWRSQEEQIDACAIRFAICFHELQNAMDGV